MELFKGKVVCPMCHGNGLIFKAKIKTKKQYYIYVMNVMQHGNMIMPFKYQIL